MKALAVACLMFTVFASSELASAQMLRNTPLGIKDVGIDDRSGNKLPLDATFTNSQGQQVQLARLFDGRLPVILTFNYASCPLLCKLQLNGLVESLRELEWTAGTEFRVVSISIDPLETPQQAAIAKQNHLTAYGRAASSDGWAFLTERPSRSRRPLMPLGSVTSFCQSNVNFLTPLLQSSVCRMA